MEISQKRISTSLKKKKKITICILRYAIQIPRCLVKDQQNLIFKCYKLEINTASADLTVHIFLVSLGGLGDPACSLARD